MSLFNSRTFHHPGFHVFFRSVSDAFLTMYYVLFCFVYFLWINESLKKLNFTIRIGNFEWFARRAKSIRRITQKSKGYLWKGIIGGTVRVRAWAHGRARCAVRRLCKLLDRVRLRWKCAMAGLSLSGPREPRAPVSLGRHAGSWEIAVKEAGL